MTEKKWVVVWPTTWQLLPIFLAWGGNNAFNILSDRQICGDFFYDFISFLLFWVVVFMEVFFLVKFIWFLFNKEITAHVQLLVISILIFATNLSSLYPEYRISMLVDNFITNESKYEYEIHKIMQNSTIVDSGRFEYYDAIVPDNNSFCYQGIRVLRNNEYLFILIPVNIYNEMSKFSYFQGYLYSKTGEYPEDIFPNERTNLLKKINKNWYLIYEAPPDRTRFY